VAVAVVAVAVDGDDDDDDDDELVEEEEEVVVDDPDELMWLVGMLLYAEGGGESWDKNPVFDFPGFPRFLDP
jgi:hypothetical protein